MLKKYYLLIWNSNFMEHSFFLNYICVYVCVGMYRCECRGWRSPEKAHQVRWSCSHRRLWASSCGCRVPTLDPLQERDASLTTEPSFALAMSDSSSAPGHPGWIFTVSYRAQRKDIRLSSGGRISLGGLSLGTEMSRQGRKVRQGRKLWMRLCWSLSQKSRVDGNWPWRDLVPPPLSLFLHPLSV